MYVIHYIVDFMVSCFVYIFKRKGTKLFSEVLVTLDFKILL